MEHRWGSRKAIDVPVRFIALPATIGTGRITNVSMTGAFLETRLELRPMALLYVEMIHLSQGPGRRKRLSASVVRRTELGVGIEWCEPASKSPLYTQLRTSARLQVQRGPDGGQREICFYQFDFLD
jgi:PilZ domain-containing protein